MKTITGALLTASLCLLSVVPAHAGHGRDGEQRISSAVHYDRFDAPRYTSHEIRDDHIRERIHLQHRRIARGIESGQLTGKQAAVLKKQQRKLRRLKRKFTEDGNYSDKEMRILIGKLNKASKRIRKLKHDDQYALPIRHRHHEHRRSDRDGYWGDDRRRWPRIGHAH